MHIYLIVLLALFSSAYGYNIGVGKADITGPVVETNMMGYAQAEQINNGIHLRLYSRAFVIKDEGGTIIYISVDQGMVSQAVKTRLIQKLQEAYGKSISHENVMISATHTHSGPAGFFQYLLYDITSYGFVEQSYEAFVDGMFKSVKMAFDKIQPGKIYVAKGDLLHSNINRSPYSYEFNPKEERENYSHNTDVEMILLKFLSSDGKPLGMLNWFPVHGVSMNNTNTLSSSDNKGLASLMFEEKLKPMNKDFVAAFAQANEGDNSPNLAGPKCIDTGLACDYKTSTCNGRSEKCIAFGPGKDMFESTKIIAENQFKKAIELWDSTKDQVSGPIKFVHQTVDMTKVEVEYDPREGIKPHTKHTCKGAMGFSFAAGTTDGPGAFDFVQGMKNGTKFWNIVKAFIKKPSKELSECQAPKPVLLATGEISFPYMWTPDIVETQVFRIGNLYIVGLPGEFTTMSGRRIRTALKRTLWGSQPNDCFRKECRGPSDEIVALSGLSNTYTDYITTFEEYQVQRYEGASTIYGQNTLQAYIQQFQKLTEHILKDTKPEEGPALPDFVSKTISLTTPVIYDGTPFGYSFGSVTFQPKEKYHGDEVVEVEFVGANPRNNMMLDQSFLEVQKHIQGDKWVTVKTDSNWETKFIWERRGALAKMFGRSTVRIEWDLRGLENVCLEGEFRILYHGTAKRFFKHYAFTGTSNAFQVTC